MPEKWNCLSTRNLCQPYRLVHLSLYINSYVSYALNAVNFKRRLARNGSVMFSVGCHMINPSPGWKCIRAPCVLARDWSCSCSRGHDCLEWSHEITDIYSISLDHFAVKAMAKSKGCLVLRTAQTTDFQLFHKINPWWPCVGNSMGLLPINPTDFLSKRLNFWIKMLENFHPIYWWISYDIWYYHVMDSENSRDAVE